MQSEILIARKILTITKNNFGKSIKIQLKIEQHENVGGQAWSIVMKLNGWIKKWTNGNAIDYQILWLIHVIRALFFSFVSRYLFGTLHWTERPSYFRWTRWQSLWVREKEIVEIENCLLSREGNTHRESVRVLKIKYKTNNNFVGIIEKKWQTIKILMKLSGREALAKQCERKLGKLNDNTKAFTVFLSSQQINKNRQWLFYLSTLSKTFYRL